MDQVDRIAERFLSLSRIPSVTYYGELTLAWIERMLKGALPPGEQRLVVERLSSGILRCRWCGSASGRWTTFLAHVDREGFLLQGAAEKLKSGDWSKPITGWSVAGRKVEKERIGAKLEVFAGSFSADARLIDIEEGARVKIRIEGAIRHSEYEVGHRGQYDGLAEYGVENRRDDGNFLVSRAADNCAGVTLCSSLVEDLVVSKLDVNVEVLFTASEEAGFCDLVEFVLGTTENNPCNEGLWLVVDGSDATRFMPISAKASLSHDIPTEQAKPEPLDLSTTVIRTGDQMLRFDGDAWSLLKLASWNLKRRVGMIRRYNREWFQGHHFDHVRAYASGNIALRIEEGRMIGGMCEASVLIAADQLRLLANGPDADSSEKYCGFSRVGSLAIPISNYRGVRDGKVVGECIHLHSLMGALGLMHEVVRLHERSVPIDSGPRKRQRSEPRVADLLLGWRKDCESQFRKYS